LGTHKEEGHYAIAVGEGSIRVLGRWWIAAAQRGEVEAHGKFMNLWGEASASSHLLLMLVIFYKTNVCL